MSWHKGFANKRRKIGKHQIVRWTKTWAKKFKHTFCVNRASNSYFVK